jgi:glycosyltransferase involved in cell wall biosynthesis
MAWRRTERLTLALARVSGADLVHLNSIVLSGSASALSRGGVPYVWHVREHPPSQGLRTAFIRQLLLQHSQRNIFISQADQSAWTGQDGGNVIPNFVDLADWSADRHLARRALGIPEGSPTVLYVGGLSPLKGIFPFLRALVDVHRQIPALRALMPGALYPEPPTPALRYVRNILPWFGLHTAGQSAVALIEQSHLGECCVRLPFQYSMAPMYAAADAVVFPALRPHFARPVIEAAAAGVPAIASRLNGIEELVEDGQTGVLVPPGDSEAIKDAMLSLLTQPDVVKRLGEAARQQAAKRFSASVNVPRIMNLYDTILAEQKRA